MIGRRPAAITGAVVLMLGTVGCGGDSRELAGYVREPKPQVGDVALPDGTNDLEPFALTAQPGGLLVTYFGYTNCPDFCPTTMSDLKLALARIDGPERVQVAMVTVDPDRDFVRNPDLCDEAVVLACYVTSFIDGAHALGTDDPALLERAAAPLGVAYNVTTNGDDIEVGHTTSLYAIDDQGELVLTWQYGVTIDDLAADLEQLLDEAAA